MEWLIEFICIANSREGTRINACISLHSGSNPCKTGRRKAIVLPDPVGEIRIISFSFSLYLRVANCISLSVVIPNLLFKRSNNIFFEVML